MSLQLIIGGSGSGKSTYMCSYVTKEAKLHPDREYIAIVPEQYTMETQKRMVMAHDDKGIINIDIVSFNRLAFRVFEELGSFNLSVLDDTGKNLIIRKIMEEMKGELSLFQAESGKYGFVSEVKSVLSEFLQYDIKEETIEELIGSIKDNQVLCGKLSDMLCIYKGFKEYIKDNFITSEEVLEVLCGIIDDSALIRDTTFVIDGFTGFTPLQYKVIRHLIRDGAKVVVTVTIDTKEKLNVIEGMQNIFYLSKETIRALYDIADDENAVIDDNIVLDNKELGRFKNNEILKFLEDNIFRYNKNVYRGKYSFDRGLRIYKADNPKEELNFCISTIVDLTRNKGYRYRDIAIVSGDMETYGDIAQKVFAMNDIPVFIDQKKSIIGNPFVEMLRSAIEIITSRFSYDSVLRFLRSGFTDIEREDIDYIDNYCIAMGIRGSRMWKSEWTRNYAGRKQAKFDLTRINVIRDKIINPLADFEEAMTDKEASVKDYVTALYELGIRLDSAARLEGYANKFENKGELAQAGQYRQVYKKIIELYDKIVSIIGTEKMSVKEFAKIFDAGLSEIKVGVVPPSFDGVTVGDIERTRIDNVKIMFFIGVNDNVIPARGSRGSILSDNDRELLCEHKINMSMTSREKAFIEKFYLYLNMTKPSDMLYITMSSYAMDNSVQRPAYIVYSVLKMFPGLEILNAGRCATLGYLKIPKSKLIWNEDNCMLAIGEMAALRLFGDEIYGSVTRLEQFASCEMAHFLSFGLGLQPRERFELAGNDIGNLLHESLRMIGEKLKEDGKKFSELTDKDRMQMVYQIVESVAREYGNTIMMDSNRNEYLVKRLMNITDRTVWAIGKQLDCGEFNPDMFEAEFETKAVELDSKARMILKGKIDRIDIAEDEENVYVKVIDYKSGTTKFELLHTYYGLKMQLIAYLKAAMELENIKHPDKNIIPAGILYYNINNPIVDNVQDESAIEMKILKELIPTGLINSDENILLKFDENMYSGDELYSIKAGVNKDKQLKKSKELVGAEDLKTILQYVDKKEIEFAKDIVNGHIQINPYKSGNKESCTYCKYNSICGFSTDIKGMNYKTLKKFTDEEIWKRMYES